MKRENKSSSIPMLNIKVVGIGGGGGNAVSRISRDFMRGVEFIAINTDHQDLDHCDVRKKVYIGKNLTKGLGTGMNPDIGRQAAEENRSEIAEALKGADLIFLAAGLGGGTGSGTTPVVAEAARQTGALTLAFVTKPFAFEGSQRQRIAEEALVKLRDKVDALVVVPNDRIFTIISQDTPIMKAFEAIDDVLKSSLAGIVELIVTPGIVNVDFADVRSVIQDAAGAAIVGIGIASGPDRAIQAVNKALNSPLLDVSPEGAHGVLLGISGGRDMKMQEINDAAKIVAQTVDPGARIIFGAYYDRRLKPNQIKITVIATGFNSTAAGSLFGGNFQQKSSFPGEARGGVMFRDDVKPRPVEEARLGGNPNNEELLFAKKPPIVEPEPKEEKKKKPEGDDVWDIPTFLRRKKR
ncbi:MAG TPA: cell division protein FtsZ [Candidatus Paceibacterota bacterium]|nr:cell division protein FtsZ [Candidatus Paceibacterota bacterium]